MAIPNLTAAQRSELRSMIEHALDDCSDLRQIAAFLRLDQLREQVLHPDDCCGWDAHGSTPAMAELGELLERFGIEGAVDTSARSLFAHLLFSRTTLQEIDDYSTTWGKALGTAQNWQGYWDNVNVAEEMEP